jgi:Secretion system C-terminal sorting domain
MYSFSNRFLVILLVTLLTIAVAFAEQGEVVWLDQINDEDSFSYESVQGYISSTGELIISGYYESLDGNYFHDHLVVAKYSTDGVKVWQTEIRGDGAIDGDMYAVEDSEGSIFVAAGYSYMLSLTKLSSSGSIIWTADHEHFRLIAGIDIALDGKVIVAGQGPNPDNPFEEDFAFGSFYPSDEDAGLIYWDAHYGGIEGGWVNPIRAGMDAEGNMYIGGTATGQDQVQDLAVCGVDMAGLLIATGEYTTGAEWTMAYDFVVAPDGTSYVSGEGTEFTTSSAVIVCFDNGGGISWSQTIGDDITRYRGFDVELTTSGVALLTQHDEIDPYQSVFEIVFYTPAGDFQRQIESSGNWNHSDTGMLCIDPGNNAYVVASEWTDDHSITAAKYDINGNEDWVAEFGPVGDGYNLLYRTDWVGWHADGLFGVGVTDSGYNFDDGFLSFKMHEVATSVEEVSLIATDFGVSAAYPNPFNSSTQLQVSLVGNCDLNISVYDVLGQQVAVIADAHFPSGLHRFTFDASHLASGLYYIHVTIPDQMDQVQKVILMR